MPVQDRTGLVGDRLAYTAAPAELLWISVDLGEVPAEGAAAPTWLLRLGLSTWSASVMTIGLDEHGRKALGFTAIAVAMLDLARLQETLTRLLATARPIRERLAAGRFELDPAGAAGAAGRALPPELRA